jgi:hypothetical protein
MMRRCEFEKYWPWMGMSDGVEALRREEFLRRLEGMGEYYGAGFFEREEASLYWRYAMGLKRVAETMPIMGWSGRSWSASVG